MPASQHRTLDFQYPVFLGPLSSVKSILLRKWKDGTGHHTKATGLNYRRKRRRRPGRINIDRPKLYRAHIERCDRVVLRPCSSHRTVHSWHSSKICSLYTVRKHGTSNELCRCSRHRLTMNRRYSCIATFTICLSLVCRRLVFTAIIRPSTKDTCAVVLMRLELVGRLYTALRTRSNQDKCKCRYDRENLLLLLHSLPSYSSLARVTQH